MQDRRIVLFGVSEQDKAILVSQLGIIARRTGLSWEVKNSPGAHIAIVDTDCEGGQSALTWLQRSPLVIVTLSSALEVSQPEALSLSKPLTSKALLSCLQFVSERFNEQQSTNEQHEGFISLS